VINVHRQVAAKLDGTEPAKVNLDGDLAEQWLPMPGAILDALGDETRASKIVEGVSGEQSFESLVGDLMSIDTLVHTWDLARATGQNEQLDPDAVLRAMEYLLPRDEAIRRPGGFAEKVTPSPGADEQTRFLNFCGRVV
jgi:hypothetical protein